MPPYWFRFLKINEVASAAFIINFLKINEVVLAAFIINLEVWWNLLDSVQIEYTVRKLVICLKVLSHEIF